MTLRSDRTFLEGTTNVYTPAIPLVNVTASRSAPLRRVRHLPEMLVINETSRGWVTIDSHQQVHIKSTARILTGIFNVMIQRASPKNSIDQNVRGPY